MKYKILAHWNDELLVEDVNSHLKDGWQLQGGVSVSLEPNWNYDEGHREPYKWCMRFSQAMVLP